ncbi:amino acid permease-domain-containing protein [Dactylonectria macrodidyma]|uniref:Amino acid permease-domain-containing protein n=1 Tax=Dactylonectria macrodidyma TaxID=307937 RepID=A0A9P9DKD6_9HYPO|nr:amino acid permease-domain-containing protein [Dactylonectria macrodidyma]
MSNDHIEMMEMTGFHHGTSSPPSHRGHSVQPTPPTSPIGPANNRKPRTLLRKLHSLDIFMIGICTVIGMGFYVRTGIILNTGGPGAVIYSFAFLGVLTYLVMDCLTTMLRVWPIAGAIVIFIEKFVDKEVAQVVALLYWLTFCFSFAGLTTVIGELGQYYNHDTNPKTCRDFNPVSITVSVLSLLLPFICNLLPIQIFRYIERGLGAIKLCLALTIIITMNAINSSVAKLPDTGPETITTVTQGSTTKTTIQLGSTSRPGTDVFQHQDDWNGSWFAAIVVSILIASFAFVGIEAIAVTAKEVVFETKNSMASQGAFQFPDTPEDIVPSRGSTENTNPTRETIENINYPRESTENISHPRESTKSTNPSRESNMSTDPPRDSTENTNHPRGSTGNNPVSVNATESDNVSDDIGDPGNSQQGIIENPFELASFLPIVITIIYLWGGWIVSQNVSWMSDSLPSLEWTDDSQPCNADISIFVISADKLSRKGTLPNALTGLLIINIASTSGAALYIASRTLYGFTSAFVRDHKNEQGVMIFFARVLSLTTSWGVPWVSVLASVWMSFLPFVTHGASAKVIHAIDVVSHMASVACIIVWGLLSFAALRFYRCYRKRPVIRVSGRFKSVMRVDESWSKKREIISILSTSLCASIILVGGIVTAAFNKKESSFIAIFSIIGLFVFLTVLLKLVKKPRSSYAWPRIRTGVNLDDPDEVMRIFDDLDDQIKHSSEGLD